jgi:predicted RNA binding protein YcfA (HicA-like mRNA interferase family)
MPKLRRLSGAEIIVIRGRFGCTIHAQRGSHVKLRRIRAGGVIQTLTIPTHPELDTGTCRAVLRQATRVVSEEELRPHF